MKHTDLSLEIIKNANLLKQKDFTRLACLASELKDIFANVQVFRTRTEMEVSVLNDIKFPTPDAKYWQAVREQNVMFSELVMLSYEYRKNQVEIKKLERELKEEDDELEYELHQIEIEKMKFITLNQERTAQARIAEILEWSDIKQELIPGCRYSLNDVNEHQLNSYLQRFERQASGIGKKGSPAERNNLFGQLKTARRIGKKDEKVNFLSK